MPVTRVIFLLPAYATYRVPVLNQVFDAIGNGFTVLTLQKRYNTISELALTMGRFPKTILKGLVLNFDSFNVFDEGMGSSARAILTPRLPLILFSLKPQVVISDGFGSWTILAALMGYPLVIFWEGTHHTERNIRSWKQTIRRWIVSRTKAFVANGTLAQQYLVETLVAKAETIFLGGMCAGSAPQEWVKQLESAVQPEPPIKFLFCGQLVKRKGPHHLLRAVANLAQQSLPHGFEVVLLGDGEDRQMLEQLAAELKIADRINFLGFVPPDKTWEIYASSHVFVLPTMHDNWPLVVLEAMSIGLPVLLSKYAGSYADLVEEGQNGFVFDPEDHNQLATAMAFYINHPEQIPTHSNHSKILSQSYTAEHAANQILKAVALASGHNRVSHASPSISTPHSP
jgi:glycosyltransferase involved in cell wall biosynthesis